MTYPRELARLDDERGLLAVRLEAPQLICTRWERRCEVAHVRAYITAVQALYEVGGRFAHFFDVYKMDSYASQARMELTRFALDSRLHVGEAHFLVRSRIVAMGVSTASLAAQLAGMRFESTTVPSEFQRRLQTAIAQYRQQPPAFR